MNQRQLPPRESGVVGSFRLQPPPGAFDAGRSLTFGCEVEIGSGLHTGLYWVIDEFGNMLSGPVVPDAYKKSRNQNPSLLPDPDMFRFGELPPIKKAAEE